MSASHVHPEFREVVARPAAERKDFMLKSRWIEYPVARQAIDTMQALTRMPTRSCMPNLLLVAHGYNGKTSILDRFQVLCGQAYVNVHNEAVKPVIVTQSTGSNEKGLYIAILETFHAPYRANDPTVKLRYQVIHQCRACYVQLLVLDEFHELFTGSARAQREMMGVLKLLSNELKVSIVAASTQEGVQAIHKNDQFSSRFDVLTLPLWSLGPDFQRLLAGFEQVLPLREPSGLSRPALARLVHEAAGGRIGDVQALLVEAANMAIDQGTERIDEGVLTSVRIKTWTPPSRRSNELALR